MGPPPDTATADVAAPDAGADLSVDVGADAAADLPADTAPDLAPDAPPIASDATDGGTGDAPDAGPGALALIPDFHVFMPTTIGSTDRFTFTAVNQGGSTLVGLGLTVTGADFALPSATNHCVGVDRLGPGASCQLDVVFRPISREVTSGYLIASASGQNYMATLTGTALRPPQLVAGPPFGSFAGKVGSTGSPDRFTVANVGDTSTGALTVALGGADAPEFTISSNGCLVPLESAATCAVDVAFKPTSPGMKTATLTVTSASGSVVVIPLTGTANAAAALTITPDVFNFGMVAAGAASASKEFAVKNTGGSATAPLTATVSTSEYVITANTCGGLSLPANGTCNISIVFAPVSAGSKLAMLVVSGAAAETGTAQLQGTAN